MRQAPLLAAVFCLLTACGNDADYPALVPIEQLLADPAGQPRVDAVEAQATQAALDARAAALTARAAALRGPVIDAPSRARLTAARPAAR